MNELSVTISNYLRAKLVVHAVYYYALRYRGYLLGGILRNSVYGRLVCINRKIEDFLQRFIYITSPETILLLSAKDSTADIPSSSTTSEDFHTIIHMLNLTYNDSPIKTSAKFFWLASCFMS